MSDYYEIHICELATGKTRVINSHENGFDNKTDSEVYAASSIYEFIEKYSESNILLIWAIRNGVANPSCCEIFGRGFSDEKVDALEYTNGQQHEVIVKGDNGMWKVMHTDNNIVPEHHYTPLYSSDKDFSPEKRAPRVIKHGWKLRTITIDGTDFCFE